MQPGSHRHRILFNSTWRFKLGEAPEVGAALAYSNLKEWLLPSGKAFRNGQGTAPSPVRPFPVTSISHAQPDFNDSDWRVLNLPHDWGVEGPFRQEYPGETGKLQWWGTAWYRKSFTVEPSQHGQQFYLDVDGAMAYAAVWLNGEFVGGWPYGYASFRLDLTPHLRFDGPNLLAIRLDNPEESSRWYPGGGIYRNVWLTRTNPVHIGHWGTFVTTPEVSSDSATVAIRAKVENHSNTAATVQITTTFHELNADGTKSESVAMAEPQSLDVPSNQHTVVTASVTIANPKRWTLKQTQRYVAVTTIRRDAEIFDEYETIFGIRSIQFDAQKGFLLNGERTPIRGVCNHHDLGALGTAMHVRALERQIELLQEMGCNAIRTSHNPPAPELLDLCDRMGMLVMDEAFDCWYEGKKPNDYHLLFNDWHESDLRALIRRDRNHPCVILWSTGNEVVELRDDLKGPAISRKLAAIAHEEDPSRLVTVASNIISSGFNSFPKTIDVFGYNYKPAQYEKFRKSNSQQPLIGSETASTVSSRGEYFFPLPSIKTTLAQMTDPSAFTVDAPSRSNFQVSSYDLHAPEWATLADCEFYYQDKLPYLGGEFVWTGFDYLGEPTPYNTDTTNLLNFTDPTSQAHMKEELQALGKIKVPSRSSYFGIIDLAGIPKDRFYLYQARWRADYPMVHILPHWTWPERVGEITPVFVYTTGDEVELFLNGVSLGRKKKAPLDYRLRWDDVKYQPGELKAVAWRNQQPWEESLMRTAGAPAGVTLRTDRSAVKADGTDLAYITASVIDVNGTLVPRANNKIEFAVTGPGDLIALDNGDPTSHQPFQASGITAFNGLCIAIIRTRANEPGEIQVTATSSGLAAASLTVVSSQALS